MSVNFDSFFTLPRGSKSLFARSRPLRCAFLSCTVTEGKLEAFRLCLTYLVEPGVVTSLAECRHRTVGRLANQAHIDRSKISVIEVEEPRDLWLTCWLIQVWCSILPSASHRTVCESGIHVFHCQTVLFIMHVLSIFVQASLCVVAGRCET